jgi:hypothetical protein
VRRRRATGVFFQRLVERSAPRCLATGTTAYEASRLLETITNNDRQYGAGHFFEHDPAAVQQLKALTSEMRLGLDLGIPNDQHVQRHDLGEWTIGQSDSDSEDDEERILDR